MSAAVMDARTMRSQSSKSASIKEERHHNYGPWLGFKFKYRCLRCGHLVPAAFVGSDQPECLKAIEEEREKP
jgi:hypothetical protein